MLHAYNLNERRSSDPKRRAAQKLCELLQQGSSQKQHPRRAGPLNNRNCRLTQQRDFTDIYQKVSTTLTGRGDY